MKNNFTLLKALDRLALTQLVEKKKFEESEINLLPKEETIRTILAYAKSVKCYKTKSIDKVLLVVN